MLRYPPSPPSYASYAGASLWEQIQAVQLLTAFDHHEKAVQALRTRYSNLLQSVGPAGADYFIYGYYSAKLSAALNQSHEEAIKHSVEISSTAIRLENPDDHVSLKADSEQQSVLSTSTLKAILSTFEPQVLAEVITMSLVSPKLAALVQLLQNFRSASFRGIVFVEQRHIAATLSWLLVHLSEIKDWIKCSVLTGHGGKPEENGEGMGLNAQRKVVDAFRRGDVNLCKLSLPRLEPI